MPVSAQDVRVRTLDVVSVPDVTRGIPESLRHPNPRERGNYPWLDEVGVFSEEAINGYTETYGAFEFAFEPALQIPDTITWTRFEVIAPEGIDYHFVSWFAADGLIRAGFDSYWLPLMYGEASPARYILFAEQPAEITINSFTYYFRTWDELASVIGLHEDMADTLAHDPAFPQVPLTPPVNGWIHAPYVSTTTVTFPVSEREDFISILAEIERLVHLLACTMQPYMCN